MLLEMFNDRILILDGVITDAAALKIVEQLLKLQELSDEKDVWLIINSLGGSLTAGLAVYDA